METKHSQVKKLVAKGEYKKALQICKEWNYRVPSHRETLRIGYECLMYPNFYRMLGKNPDELYEKAVKVLHEVYD